MLLQLSTRWREMTKQPGAALPPEAVQLQQQQVRILALEQHYDIVRGHRCKT